MPRPADPQVCAQLLALKPTVVRGNASEILALAGAAGAATKGVDSTAASTGAGPGPGAGCLRGPALLPRVRCAAGGQQD